MKYWVNQIGVTLALIISIGDCRAADIRGGLPLQVRARNTELAATGRVELRAVATFRGNHSTRQELCGNTAAAKADRLSVSLLPQKTCDPAFP